MSNLKISQLPEYTGNTTGVYLVMNNSGETTTYKVKKETLSAGTSGTSGTSGSSGSSGSNGSSGTSGSSGNSGASGSNGSSGTSGSNGSSGTSGSSGVNGSSGTSGSNGSSGTSGSSGVSGTSGTSGDSIFAQTGSYWNTTKNVGITGSLNVSGSLTASGSYNILSGNNGNAIVAGNGGLNSIVANQGTGYNNIEAISGSNNLISIENSLIGRLRVEGNSRLSGSVTITGSLIVSGTLHNISGPVNISGGLNVSASAANVNNVLSANPNSGGGTNFLDAAGNYIISRGGPSHFVNNAIIAYNGGGNLITGSYNRIEGPTTITGSVQGNIVPLTITSNTASLNLNNGNFFNLQLVSGSATHLVPTNIKEGQTVTIFVNTIGSATMTFPNTVKQISGSSYIPTTTTGVDILTLTTNTANSIYLVNAKNFI